LVVVVLALGACGVPTDDRPRALHGVALPDEPVPEEAPADDRGPVTLVYLVGDETLVPVGRASPPTLVRALELLVEGPRADEVAFGVRSAIPAGTEVLGASVSGGVASIDLTSEFTSVVGPEQILAVAQVVFTATGIRGVDDVAIAIDGVPVNVARGDGTLSEGTVDRSDYRALVG
jgi:hypothetical protein